LILLASLFLLACLAPCSYSNQTSSTDAALFEKQNGFCNLSNAWKFCVNHTFPCPCYALECPQNRGNDTPWESLTVEKAIILEYNRILFERTYEDAWAIFAPYITLNVPYFQISFTGAATNVAYLYLGDPSVSDQYVILSSEVTEMLQQGYKVYATVSVTYQNTHTGVIWPTTNQWVTTFAPNRTMVLQNIYIDSAGTLDILYATGTLNLNTTTLCQSIMKDCTGANTQYNGDLPTCIAFMNALVVRISGLVATGDSVFCRSFHEVLARSDPEIHCPHTGPLKINPAETPCNNFTQTAKTKPQFFQELAENEIVILDW